MGTETNLMLLYLIVQMRCSVKLNTPDGDGNSTIGNFSPSCKRLAVKLNNPLMGTETAGKCNKPLCHLSIWLN